MNNDKQNLEEEIKYLKSKTDNYYGKNTLNEPAMPLHARQKYEEELSYYKTQTLELQQVNLLINNFLENSRAQSQ